MLQPNEAAFLSMIAHAEGTDQAADPYRVCFGYTHTIVSFAEHPAITGEWIGQGYEHSWSTAAGRYQINRPTWRECQQALHLIDFTPDSQDAAALFLIRQKGALALIERGLVHEAIAACRNVWASLPGGDSGQPEHSFASLIDVYTQAGGMAA